MELRIKKTDIIKPITGTGPKEICRIKDKPKHWVLIFKNGTIVVIPKEVQ